MYSKYILSSNWKSLSSEYAFDKDLNFNNVSIYIDGNIDLNFAPTLSGLSDYNNNNYSLFFLTKNTNVNNFITKEYPILDINKQTVLLATDFRNNLVSDITLFLKLENDNLSFVKITELNNDNFFEIDYVTANELYVYTVKKGIFYYICVDDITTSISVLSSDNPNNLTNFQKNKIRLNYLFDKKRKSIVLYKVIQNDTYVLTKDPLNVFVLLKIQLNDVIEQNFLNLVKINELPPSSLLVNWVSYLDDVNKNSNTINSSRSLYNISNNYLIHSEYNTIRNNFIQHNIITLKNQSDVDGQFLRNNINNNFREYRTILGGGNREEGYNNISLGYTSKYYPLKIYSDKTTWFHIPYNKEIISTNINNSNFKINGAIPGTAPIYSDKIFKKAANYAFNSNMGNSEDDEQSGTWLCAWLSGGPLNSVWVDRYYNPDTFTAFAAAKYSTNVSYTPKYLGKYKAGITDVVSNLTLEPGVWYAYSRIGKKTANNIINGLNGSLISKGFSLYQTKNKSNILQNTDTEGEASYNFNKNTFASTSIEKLTSFNNFTISFFGARENWDNYDTFQMLGNYLDSGFGVFNDLSINPNLYYVNGKILYILNKNYKNILTIDTNYYLNVSGYNIKGFFRRDLNSNVHVITDNNYLLEFNANGTIVDLSNLSNVLSGNITSVTNNNINGYIYTDQRRVYQINLFSNFVKDITNDLRVKTGINFNYQNSNTNFNIVTDVYDNVYIINGIYPILKGTNIYFKSPDSLFLQVYDINENSINIFLSGSNSEKIMSYNFDNSGFTYLLYKNRISEYDALGNYIKDLYINVKNRSLSGLNFIVQNIGGNSHLSVHVIDRFDRNLMYNVSLSSVTLVDENYNNVFNLSGADLQDKIYDISNYNYNQGIITSNSPIASYKFILKLFNQLNYEDARILTHNVLGEYLNTGEHHFAITLNTIKGEYNLYIDGKLFSKKTFTPKKYSFTKLLTDTILAGATPFYGGVLYSDYYNVDKDFLFVNDFKIDKFKIYDEELTAEEIRLLYFQKYPPKDVSISIPIGERNYLDTITRTFRHKMQGSKSNLINLFINDSLITDKSIQKIYELKILDEIKRVLPSYIKINSITWLNNKEGDEKMIEGNFNVRNTVTDTL